MAHRGGSNAETSSAGQELAQPRKRRLRLGRSPLKEAVDHHTGEATHEQKLGKICRHWGFPWD